MILYYSKEAQSYLTLWTNIWLRKWKQRIKLLIGQQQPNKTNTPPQATAETESRWNKLENKQEMLQMIIFTLIRNAEICGTNLIAENILKTELTKHKDPEINGVQQKLTILNHALRRAKETSQRTGPLLSVSVNKDYYKR